MFLRHPPVHEKLTLSRDDPWAWRQKKHMRSISNWECVLAAALLHDLSSLAAKTKKNDKEQSAQTWKTSQRIDILQTWSIGPMLKKSSFWPCLFLFTLHERKAFSQTDKNGNHCWHSEHELVEMKQTKLKSNSDTDNICQCHWHLHSVVNEHIAHRSHRDFLSDMMNMLVWHDWWQMRSKHSHICVQRWWKLDCHETVINHGGRGCTLSIFFLLWTTNASFLQHWSHWAQQCHCCLLKLLFQPKHTCWSSHPIKLHDSCLQLLSCISVTCQLWKKN